MVGVYGYAHAELGEDMLYLQYGYRYRIVCLIVQMPMNGIYALSPRMIVAGEGMRV